jgi:hypothetical protein
MAISEQAQSHYLKVLMYKHELNPAAALAEIQAALEIELLVQLANKTARREWDGSTMIEFQILSAWASLSLQDYVQAENDMLMINNMLKIDPSLQVNPDDLKPVVEWASELATANCHTRR